MGANWGERRLCFAKLHSAGISLRLVRSPLAPKITITQGLAWCPCPLKLSVIFVLSGVRFPIPVQLVGARRLLHVAAKLKSHGGKEFGRKFVFPARNKTLEQRCRENRCWRRRFDSRKDRPASLTGIRYSSGKSLKGWLLQQRNRRQVEKPAGHYTASPPHFGYIGQREVVSVIFRIAQRGGLGIHFASSAARVGVLEDVQPFSVGTHQCILDSVVHHLHEVPCSRRAAMQIAFFGSSRNFLPPRWLRHVAASRRERFEDRIEMSDNLPFATNHLPRPALQGPYSTARATVHVLQTFGGKFVGAANIIDVIRISAIDHNVAGVELSSPFLQRVVHHRRRIP